MGFFSYLCKECGHPLLCRQATSKGINEWMTNAVVLTPHGAVIQGDYDGYGQVGRWDDDFSYAVCLHTACWEKAGKPGFAHYGGPSDGAPDQGWFFEDGAHDMIDPRITEGREVLLAAGVKQQEQDRYDGRLA